MDTTVKQKVNTGVPARLILATVLVAALFTGAFAKSRYYHENFEGFPLGNNITTNGAHTNNGWIWNFRMSRDIMASDVWADLAGSFGNDYPAGVMITNNLGSDKKLYLYGKPNNRDILWNNWYVGDGVKFDPKLNSNLQSNAISATSEDPFGYTIIRYETSIDPQGGAQSGEYVKGFIGTWLAEDNGAASANDRYDNFVYFYDKSRYDAFNVFGVFNNVEYDKDWNNLLRDTDGVSVGTVLNVSNNFRKQMDLDSDAGDPAENNSKWYNTRLTYDNPVTYPLGIRMTTDGSSVRIFVNYNPTNDPGIGLNNAWVLVDERPANIKNDILALLIAETPYFRPESIETQFDNFLVRTVASNVSASITPRKAVSNAQVRFTVDVRPEGVTANDSGIGEIYIKKPAGYGAFNLNNLIVSNAGQQLQVISNGAPTAAQVYATNLGAEIYLRFCMTSKAVNGILTNTNATVSFLIQTPTTMTVGGDEFEVYADCVKHFNSANDILFDPANGIKYATTGRKKARPAADRALYVTTYSQPKGGVLVEYSPAPMIVGNESAAFSVKLFTVSPTSPDITSFRILIPTNVTGPNFYVSNNSAAAPYAIRSQILGNSSSNNISILTSGGSNFITVYYTNQNNGSGLNGYNGFDLITFNVYGTPTVPNGVNYTNYRWLAQVNSSDGTNGVAGTEWQIATNSTNAIVDNYNITNQDVRIGSSNAMLSAYITPASVAINPVYSSNAVKYNYYFRNNGPAGNTVYQMRVTIPSGFSNNSITNAAGATNAFALSNCTGTAVYSNSAIWVQFNAPGLTNNQTGMLTFYASHTNTNINSLSTNFAFTAFADNSNTAGYNLMTEDAPNTWGVSVNPPKPDASYTASIIRIAGPVTNTNMAVYTSDISNRYVFTVNNLSPNGVSLRLLKIEYPTNLFTLVSSNSEHLASQNNILVSNGTGGTNYIWLKYHADANGDICSAYDNATNAPFKRDIISLWFTDKITNGLYSAMPTNMFFTVKGYKTDISGATNDEDSDVCKVIAQTADNLLKIEYPYLEMEYSLDPYQIDTTSVANVITNIIVNRGNPGNRILTNIIHLPRSVTTNISGVASSSSKVIQNSFESDSNWIRIIYDPALGGLDGGETNMVTFTMQDRVEGLSLQAIITNSGANDREYVHYVTNVSAGGSGTLYFDLPAPKGGGFVSPNVFYTTANEVPGTVLTQEMTITITNSGVGSDRFDAVMVEIPEALKGMVQHISNRRGSALLSTITNIIINYTNGTPNPLLTNQYDVLYVRALVSNLNGLPTNGLWRVYANNGWDDNSVVPAKRFFELTNVFTVPDRMAYGTERPMLYQAGSSLTTDLTNTNIIIYLTNGQSAGSLPVRAIRVGVPSPLYNVDVNNVFSSGASKSLSNIGGTNYIYLDYSGLIMPSNAMNIRITATRVPLIDATNVYWNTWVYYESNKQPVYMDMLRGSVAEQIVLPEAYFYAYANTNSVGKDDTYQDFTLTITNYGVTANRLYRVIIAPPSSNTNDYKTVITNITGISSLMPGTAVSYSNGMIFVNYDATNTNIPGGMIDRISFRAYDNQENPGFNGIWQVWADNSRTATRLLPVTDPELAGVGSLRLEFFQPPYSAGYSIIANSTVSTVDSQTNVVIGVANRSLGAIDISAVRLFAPYPVTNIASFTSTLGGTLVSNTVVNGSNFIEIAYTAGLFTTSTNDSISLTVRDGIDFGETNGLLNMTVRYNTSGGTYIQAAVEGGTNGLSYRMPAPVMSVDMTSNIYTTQTNGTVYLQVRVTNRGKGSNNAQKLTLTVPAALTNGLSAGSLLTNGYSTNYSFIAPDTFEVYFTNFAPGVVQNMGITLVNTNSIETEYAFAFTADNGFLSSNITVNLGVKKPPSALFVKRSLDVTAVSNLMELSLANTSSGSRLTGVRIALPAQFTNITAPASGLATAFSNTGTELFVDYGSGIAYGSGDTVTFWVMDNTNMFETNNIAWTVEANNGSGYGRMREDTSGGLKTAFYIPSPSVTNILNTGWFQINTGGALTNQFRFTLTNRSAGQNYVISNRVKLPAELTNIVGAVSTTVPGASVTVSGSELHILYTSAPYLSPDSANVISFSFLNNVLSRRNVYADFVTYNPGTTNAPDESRQKVEFLAPGEQTEGYVYNRQKIYSIDNTATVVYKVNNGMYDLGIERVLIGFSNAQLNVTNVRSYIYGTSVPFTTDASNLVIDYRSLSNIPGKLGLSNGQETIYIDIVYTNNNSWTNEMRSRVVFQASLDESAAAVPSGETASLPVLVADFGRITGIALPGNANPAVKLYAPGIYTNIVTNADGLLSVTANQQSGVYTLDFVPPGTYDVGFSGASYKESYLTNIVVTVNRVTNIGTYKMTRDYLRPGAGTEQLAVSLDDTNTFVAVPVGVVGESFTLDIWLTNFNAAAPDMELKANGGTIETPAVPSAVKVWWFDMRGSSGDTVTEQEIKSNIVVTLHYEDAEITAQGWSESRLSVYYWKSLTREWVRIGGTVDPVANTISFTGSYIHKYYVVLGDSAQARPETPAFVSVSVEPRIFTPRSGGNDTGNVKIAFALDQGVTETTYELKIYDVTGRAVKTFKRDAPYKQGEVFWDGKDDEGFPVRSGVYVYRVIVGSQVYSGTIVIAR